MPLLPLLIAVLAAFAILMVFMGLARSAKTPNTTEERLQMYGVKPRTLEEIELQQPFSERALLPLIRGLARLLSRTTPQRNVDQIRHKLDLAGNPNNWSPADFVGLRGLAAVLVAILGTTLGYALHMDPFMVILFLGIGGILGYYFPLLWLNRVIRARQRRVQKQLPDAMDLLTISVESGLGFDAAMGKVADKWNNDLSRAFGRALGEMRIGKLRREALRDMAARIELPDFSNFIAAIIQADQLGISIGKVLRIQSEQMRIKRRQRAEEKANQAPIKMLIPLAFLVFPSIFIILLGPTVVIFMTGGFNVP
ncbi:type II secretion system F family protein [Anaerolineae bacterium CFX7]|nr:type II secretion system F family protein [Anaerolineae bacterium CFX7]